MKHTHIIYKLTFPNNKVYIGQTSDNFESYINKYISLAFNKKHKSYNRPLCRAIRKYGWDNVKKEILFTTSNEVVDELETQMIAEYNATDRRFGYNILKIGGSPRGYKRSEESKQKQSIKLSGKNNYWYGKDFSGKNNPHYGKHHSEETKEKIGKKSKLKNFEYLYKKIKVYDKQENFIKIFNSLSEASRKMKINCGHICEVCKGNRKSAGGYVFKYL